MKCNVCDNEYNVLTITKNYGDVCMKCFNEKNVTIIFYDKTLNRIFIEINNKKIYIKDIF